MQPPVDNVNLKNNYEIFEELGRGSFSIVWKCRHITTQKLFAVKTFKIIDLNERDIKRIEREINICKNLKHKNIVKLHEHYSDANSIYIVFDLLLGGELFNDIMNREFYSEVDAGYCMQQILEGLAYCHRNNVIHRDVKPENLLLNSKEKNPIIQVADFGLAVRVLVKERSWYGFVGTAGYLSPEVIRREEYGFGVDVWACGIILYILLCGYPPFWDDDQQKLYNKVLSGRFQFYSPDWDSVTHQAKEIIKLMLNIDQQSRPTIELLLEHPWFKDPVKTAAKVHRQNTIAGLKKFNAKRKLRGAVQSIISINKMNQVIENNPKLNHDPLPLDITPPINWSGSSHYMETKFIPSSNEISMNMAAIPYHALHTPDAQLNAKREISSDSIADYIIKLTQKLIESSDDSEYSSITDKTTMFDSNVPFIMIGSAEINTLKCPNQRKETIKHPIVHTMANDVACVAFIRVSTCQYNNQCSCHVSVISYKETIVWQRESEMWHCLHRHSSKI